MKLDGGRVTKGFLMLSLNFSEDPLFLMTQVFPLAFLPCSSKPSISNQIFVILLTAV